MSENPLTDRPGPAEPSAPDAAAARRKRRGYFLPGTIALLALVGIGAALGAGDLSHPAGSHLDGRNVEEQITLALSAQGGPAHAATVTCPASEPLQQGLSFTCRVTDSSGRQSVVVTEVDSRGGVRWALAR